MMRVRALVVLLALAVATAALADVYSEQVGVSDVSQTLTFPAAVGDVSIYNPGQFDAYVRLYSYCEEPGDIVALVGSGVFRIPAGDALAFKYEPATECSSGYGYRALSRRALPGEGGVLEVIAK